MLYLTCPTCGYFLGQKTIQYEAGKKDICSNPKLSEEEKEKNIHYMRKINGGNTKQEQMRNNTIRKWLQIKVQKNL